MLPHYRLSKAIHFSGVSIHSNAHVELSIEPADDGAGISFIRRDLDDFVIPVSVDALSVHESKRHTVLNYQGQYIRTPEHLLAALYALRIYDANIYINHDELPIMDGSSKIFVDSLMSSGLDRVSSAIQPIIIDKPILCSENDARIIALPSSDFRCSYLLSYPMSFVGTQMFSSLITDDLFVLDIAPARTFGFESEVQVLLDRGLAKGASLENAVVIGETAYLNDLRYDDELSRHKCLDMIGDLSILSRPIQGHIIGICSGHFLNASLVKEISLRSS